MLNFKTINGSNRATVDKSRFYKEIDSSSCLLVDSDILENIPS